MIRLRFFFRYLLMNEKPLILISNDDGYKAKGIRELVSRVCHLGDVIVCAPETAQSGKSRAFTMGELKIRELCVETDETTGNEVRWYACSGTPVDCVKIAYSELCPRCPDLVLSGINHGDNASSNAHYSGTVGVAFEAALKDIPSIAFSISDFSEDADFRGMYDVIDRLCNDVLKHGLPRYTCLNVNVPKTENGAAPLGMKVCRMAYGRWLKEVEPLGDADDTYQLRGFYSCDEPEAEDTDRWALEHGFVSVTPCLIDITAFKLMDEMRERLK